MDDQDYFQQRATAELDRAECATHAKAAAAHRKLAEAYLSRASSSGARGAVSHRRA